MATTIHTRKNFEPSDYVILDYFDNQAPKYFGQSVYDWNVAVENWKQKLIGLYGEDYSSKICRCAHCHKGNVRYVVAVRHIPSGDVVTFGDICVEKLGFANRDELKAAEIRSKAKLANKRLRIYKSYCAYLEANPAVQEAEKEIENPVHDGNNFARDILAKLKRFGSISDRQRDTMLKSLKDDYKRVEEKKKRDERNALSEYVGEVNERIFRELTCEKVIAMDSMYGTTGLHIMTDKENNQFIWFASGSAEWMRDGQTALTKFTVKDHREYRGVKQTVVNRLKIH